MVAGLYATQIFIESYDSGNVLKNSIPLDFIWRSTPPCTVNCVTVTSNPLILSFLPITSGQWITFTVTQTTTNPSDYTSKITNIHSAAHSACDWSSRRCDYQTCAAGSASTTVFRWTPNLQSTGAVVCFQGSATSGGGSVQCESAVRHL